MGISRITAHKWVRRWRRGGRDGPARPLQPAADDAPPHAGRDRVQVCRLRQDRKLGPARIGPILDLPASTVHRILTRHGLNRLAFLDRPTGRLIRRYEREHARRTAPRRREKTRPDPRRRRPQDPRPRRRPAHPRHGLRLRPLRHRRPHPPRLQRGPRRRESRHLRGLPRQSRRVLPDRGHRPHRRGPDRQRLALPQELRLARRPRPPRRERQTHPCLPATDQRQGRTLPPHPG